MIVVDTSVVIDSLTGPKRSAAALRAVIESGERLLLPSLVLYEWLRGPRLAAELTAQEALFPSEAALPFGAREAVISARLYQSVHRPRGRELDLAIAACALAHEAALWTLNAADFTDIRGLRLWPPAAARNSVVTKKSLPSIANRRTLKVSTSLGGASN
jgi:predicted nucleic acid-binding protein